MDTPAVNKPSWLSRLGHWVAELILVFVGVYAAFWLNAYQQHRQDAQRRDQILAALEQQLTRSIASGKIAGAKEDQEAASFRHALDAGKMPPLHPYTFTSDYSPGDVEALLQSGGIQLLDAKTLATLRRVESVIRWGLADLAHYQALSDELIVPNLDRPTSFFYDSRTRRLKRRFEIYPEALQETAKFAHNLEQAQAALLEQIRLERQR